MSRHLGARLVLLAGALVLLGPVAPASAELTGPCEAQGQWSDPSVNGGQPVDARTIGDRVVTIPLKDSVAWFGSVTPVQNPRAHSGSVSVDLPWPLDAFTVESWSGSGSEVQKNGVEEYELPSLTPRGITFKVQGTHTEDGGLVCTGYVNLQVAGSKLSNPIIYAAIAATVAAGAAFAALLVPVFRRVR